MSEANDNGACADAPPDERLLRQIPGYLGALVAAGHGEAALILIKTFGGTQIDLPTKAENSSLAKRIGLEAARKLLGMMPRTPCRIRIPSAASLSERKSPLIIDAIEEGYTNTEIARRLGVTDTYVSRIRQMMKPQKNVLMKKG
jgi:transcriptional regulator with XRE-family HTH domain